VIVEQLVEKAMRKAQAAQAVVRQTESTEVKFEKDRLKATQTSQRTQIELKVIVDGRIGSSSGTDPEDLDGIVARALETAPFGREATFAFPSPQECPQVKVYDERVVGASTAEMVAIGEEIVARVNDYNADILIDAGIGKDSGRIDLANSAGTTLTSKDTDFGAEVEGVLVRGTDVLYTEHAMGGKQRDLDHGAFAQEIIHYFRLAENLAPMESGDLPVILTPAAAAILLLPLYLGLDGKNVLLGSSPLADSQGRRIADSRFSLVDDPLVDFAAGSSPFDGEGVPRKRTPLIEQGVVANFLYDLDTASRAGAQPSGHGPNRRPTNLLIAPGDTSYEEMVKSIGRGLLVHEVLGLGQGNAISGDFSVNVQLGYKIENGEIVGRVKDVMLAGNIYDALQDIAAIGDTPQWRVGYFSGAFPYIQLGKLSVVAG